MPRSGDVLHDIQWADPVAPFIAIVVARLRHPAQTILSGHPIQQSQQPLIPQLFAGFGVPEEIRYAELKPILKMLRMLHDIIDETRVPITVKGCFIPIHVGSFYDGNAAHTPLA